MARISDYERASGSLPLIWVVDDSNTQAAFTQRSLGDQYRFERFADGPSVIERLVSSSPPDLILLDWVMPGLGGDEVCRYMRGTPQGKDLPIIMLTAARIGTEHIVLALESGANDYVSKPFEAEELRARVNALLRADAHKRGAIAERERLVAVNQLGSLLHTHRETQQVLDVVANWLVDTVCDGAELRVTPKEGAERVATRHGAGGPGEHSSSHELELSDIATLHVTLVSDAASGPFDAADQLTIDTGLESAALAVEAALRSEAERATTRFLEEMLGIVGHDLRTPLGAIHLGLEMLEMQGPPAQSSGVLARVQRSAQRMSTIVEQLLDVTRARIGAGIPVTLAKIPLRAAVERVADELRLSKPAAILEVSGDEVDGNWDGDRLEQVITNLASNALHYGKTGAPIRLEVSSSEASAFLLVSNELAGAPIPADELEHLFDPFRRGRNSRNPDGLGLGLYIVCQIVRAHHGSIKVESDQAGTRFRMTLPR
ncbi:MAG: response regulator [Deltaproteobacteria bacterium]|nr:response regulator [Deltaproteobacteria bacterium]